MMMSAAVVGLFWRLLYDPSWGIINYALHLGDFAWLSNPHAALYAVAITDIDRPTRCMWGMTSRAWTFWGTVHSAVIR